MQGKLWERGRRRWEPELPSWDFEAQGLSRTQSVNNDVLLQKAVYNTTFRFWFGSLRDLAALEPLVTALLDTLRIFWENMEINPPLYSYSRLR